MDLKFVKPKSLGISAERLMFAHQVIQRGLDEGLYPGAVYLIGRRSGVLEPVCFGVRYPNGSDAVTPDTVYDIASVTKPVATAAALLLLVERGQVHLRQKIGDFFPGMDLPHLREVTVKHLLTHTSGLPAWRDLCSGYGCKEEIINGVLSIELESSPGTTYRYSCLGYMLLGAIIEKISGRSLDNFTRNEIFQSLGMEDTGYNPGQNTIDRSAATANCPARPGKVLVGTVHDANAWAMGGVSGNAGIFSTVSDLAKFALMVLNGGLGIFSPAAVSLMCQNLLDPAIGGHSAGWFIAPNDMLPVGDLSSIQAIGHTGFTGTSVVIDTTCDIFVILLTNRVCIGVDRTEFSKTRRLFHNAVEQAVSAFV